jgi:hypothetical protein
MQYWADFLYIFPALLSLEFLGKNYFSKLLLREIPIFPDILWGKNFRRIFLGFFHEKMYKKSAPEQANLDVAITPPNSLHMLWQLPQYVLITAGEIMFSIPTLAFAFTEVTAAELPEASF